MEDDSLQQLIWDLKCEASPKCACCGRGIYTFDTYTQIGPFLFCEVCEGNRDRRFSSDLDL
ncbi:MAG: hypothetical protein IKC09_05390 [Oscillospiraceae bacterium]|nr:hypothetical protein [Oscillospiraceae bacterium]MBR2889692.1 hypothetical protein [Oscillospiraceae bacterium]